MEVRKFFTVRPHTVFDDDHSLTYEATEVVDATVTYDPHPRVIWRYDWRSDDELRVEVLIDQQIFLTLHDGTTLDLSHSGSAEIIKSENQKMRSLDLCFPRVGDHELRAQIEQSTSGVVTGGFSYDDMEIGRVGEFGIVFNCL